MREGLVGRRFLAALPRVPGALWWSSHPGYGEIESSPLYRMMFKTSLGAFWHIFRQRTGGWDRFLLDSRLPRASDRGDARMEYKGDLAPAPPLFTQFHHPAPVEHRLRPADRSA